MRIKFSGDFASSSDVVPEFDSRPKKKGLRRNLVQNSAGIWDLLVLTATFSSDRPDASLQWRALKSR